MTMMLSVEIPASRVTAIKQMIPAGVQHTVTPKNGFTHINMRTNDHALIRRIMESRRPPAEV